MCVRFQIGTAVDGAAREASCPTWEDQREPAPDHVFAKIKRDLARTTLAAFAATLPRPGLTSGSQMQALHSRTAAQLADNTRQEGVAV
jgi:hypothetical protein